MRKVLLSACMVIGLAWPAMAETLDEAGQRSCGPMIYSRGSAGWSSQPTPNMDASTIRYLQQAAAQNCEIYKKAKAKAEQRGRDAETLPNYTVQYEPIPDVEWHLTNQSVIGWTNGQEPIFLLNEDGYRMGIAGHNYFNKRVDIEEGALLTLRAGTFDAKKIETRVSFFDGPANVTMPTGAIEPTPLICEGGNEEAGKVLGTVIRCRRADDSDWVISNEDDVRRQAIAKAVRDSEALEINLGPNRYDHAVNGHQR